MFYDLLQEYASPPQFKSSSLSHSHSGGSEVTTSDVSNDFSKLLQFLSNNSSSTNVKHELDYYLQEPVLPWIEEFDILSWWKAGGLKYPTLCMTARDFLAIPISTVAFESIFSTSGRMVSAHRSRLHKDTIEALMCSQDWLWNELEGKSYNFFKDNHNIFNLF